MSYMLRTAPKEAVGRVMGVFYGAFNLGIIMGAPIGGIVAGLFGLASPLWAYAVACFVAAALYLSFVRDRGRPSREQVKGGGLRSLRWTRPFVTVLVANGAYFWMVAAVYQTLMSPFGNDRFGLSTLQIGLAASVVDAAEFAVLFPAGSLADSRGRRAVLLPAFLGLAVVVAALGLIHHVAVYLVVLLALGVGSGFGGVPTPALLSDVVPPETRPAAIGVYRFVGDLGFVLGPFVAGRIAQGVGFEAAFAVSAVPCLIAAVFLFAMREPEPVLARSDPG